MSRILKAYATRFRWLLEHVRARKLEQGVEHLIQRARRLSLKDKISLADALTGVYERLAARPPFQNAVSLPTPALFYCDAGLGGLARWLRAAGYEALWEPGIDDDELLRKAREFSATILTTDSMLMERRLLRDRVIPAVWLPPTLSIAEQLARVFREFHLDMREPRCMTCGGELRAVDKEAMRERIPPRTFGWLNKFFICTRCGQLFWHGTHWQRIEHKLRELESGQGVTRNRF